MTIRDLNPGATIQMLGEQIYIEDKQTCPRGVKLITEFKVRRGKQTSAIWTSAGQVQNWLDRSQWVENPILEDETDV